MGIIGKLFNKVLDSMDNDPTLKWNVLMKHDCIITLRGIWKTKEVFLYGRQIEG